MSARQKYKDFWLRIVGSVASSAIIDALGREDSYFHRLTTPYFYTDLLGGFVIAFILWEIVRRVTFYLDGKYDWLENTIQRILLQTLLGVIVPAFLSFVFTMLYMKLAYNQDIFQTSWLYSEYYAVILIIIMINVVYFTWWLYLKWKNQIKNRMLPEEQTLVASSSPSNFDGKVIGVPKAGKTVLLNQKEIAYAYLNDGYCYIKTFGEDIFVTSYTLDETARMLDEINFFRVNRQILVGRKSCAAYKSVENGKIELDLKPSFREPVIVSQKRAKEFRRWISIRALN